MQKRIAVWIAMMLGGIIGGLWIDWQRFRPLLLNPVFHIVSLILGVLLLQGVRTSSANTGRMLAQMGKEGDDVPRFETNKLVKSGVYRCMRHPMHLGLLFFPLAIALIIGSPAFIFFIAPVEMLLMIVMIKFIEEPEAIAKFGDEYRAYQKQTPMFNFSLNCLKQLLGLNSNG
jgi:protein-S-isoprenylcysteine O-methyltransferase Ste14